MTNKPRNTLHLRRLVSIGAVESGDDPEAQILLWKAKSEEEEEEATVPIVDRETRKRKYSKPRQKVAVDPAALVDAVTERLFKSRQEIEDGVRVLADEIVAKDRAVGRAEAVASVWRENRNLRDRWRELPFEQTFKTEAGKRNALVEKRKTAEESRTVRATVDALIVKRAEQAQAQNPALWDVPIVKIRVQVQSTEEGKALRVLARTHGDEDASMIMKSAEPGAAVLARWTADLA